MRSEKRQLWKWEGLVKSQTHPELELARFFFAGAPVQAFWQNAHTIAFNDDLSENNEKWQCFEFPKYSLFPPPAWSKMIQHKLF